LKHFRKMDSNAIFNFVHVNFVAQQVLHRSYLFAVTGDDQIKETKVGVNVQSKAVRRDPARDMNANRRHFPTGGVNASKTLDAKGVNLIVSKRSYQNFFQVPHERMDVFAIGAQVDDRITNDLAQTMIGNLSASISFKDTD